MSSARLAMQVRLLLIFPRLPKEIRKVSDCFSHCVLFLVALLGIPLVALHTPSIWQYFLSI